MLDAVSSSGAAFVLALALPAGVEARGAAARVAAQCVSASGAHTVHPVGMALVGSPLKSDFQSTQPFRLSNSTTHALQSIVAVAVTVGGGVGAPWPWVRTENLAEVVVILLLRPSPEDLVGRLGCLSVRSDVCVFLLLVLARVAGVRDVVVQTPHALGQRSAKVDAPKVSFKNTSCDPTTAYLIVVEFLHAFATPTAWISLVQRLYSGAPLHVGGANAVVVVVCFAGQVSGSGFTTAVRVIAIVFSEGNADSTRRGHFVQKSAPQ